MSTLFTTLPVEIIHAIARILRTHRYESTPCCKRHAMLRGETCTLSNLVLSSRQLNHICTTVLYEEMALSDGSPIVYFISRLADPLSLATVVKRIVFLGVNLDTDGNDPDMSDLLIAGTTCKDFPQGLCETWKDQEFLEDEMPKALARGSTTAARIRLIELLPNLDKITSTMMAGANDRLCEALERGTIIPSLQNITRVVLLSEYRRAFYIDEFVPILTLPRIHSLDIRYVELVMPDSHLLKPSGILERLRGSSPIKQISLWGRVATDINWSIIKHVLGVAVSLERLCLIDMDFIFVDELCAAISSSVKTLEYLALLPVDGFIINDLESLRHFECLRHLVTTDELFMNDESMFVDMQLPKSLEVLDMFVAELRDLAIEPRPAHAHCLSGLVQFVERGGLPKSCVVHVDDTSLQWILTEASPADVSEFGVTVLVDALAKSGNDIAGYILASTWCEDVREYVCTDPRRPFALMI